LRKASQFSGAEIQLYESAIVDVQVIPIARIVGQALLVRNMKTPRIPTSLRAKKTSIFPKGKVGSRLWMVNTTAMRAGRSFAMKF
jgi:hypothetical protein